jgi:hypothetical protein
MGTTAVVLPTEGRHAEIVLYYLQEDTGKSPANHIPATYLRRIVVNGKNEKNIIPNSRHPRPAANTTAGKYSPQTTRKYLLGIQYTHMRKISQ